MGISTDPAFKLMMTSQNNIMYLPFERFENEETEACLHLKLAKEISKEALKKNVCVSVLIEVNVAEEDSKFGVKPSEAEELIRSIAVLPGIQIKGLMTIAPYVENPEDNRQYFAQLKQLSVDINSKNIDNVSMNVLSMGMTGDYEVAIEEGATYVRVGTGVFGERQYL